MALFCSKKLSALLHEITSKHKSDFYCLNCLHSCKTENKLKSQENVCKNKDFGEIVMSSKTDKILEFNQYIKSDKMPYMIYDDIESLIEKMDLQIIQKILPQQKLESIFLLDIQCQQF